MKGVMANESRSIFRGADGPRARVRVWVWLWALVLNKAGHKACGQSERTQGSLLRGCHASLVQVRQARVRAGLRDEAGAGLRRWGRAGRTRERDPGFRGATEFDRRALWRSGV